MDALSEDAHSGGGYAVERDFVRRTPRYSFVVDVELTDLHSENQIRAQTKMLSLGGCGVDTVKLFPKGTSVRIRLSHEGAEVRAFARVVYSSAALGMGIAFTNIERDDERTLEWWIAESLRIPTWE